MHFIHDGEARNRRVAVLAGIAAMLAFSLPVNGFAKTVDFGLGPAIVPAHSTTPPTPSAPPPADATGAAFGMFGDPVQWPIIPLHVVLLPNGRVLNYGSTAAAQQGAELVYDVWNPLLGTGTNSHLTLPNVTGTDIFCAGQIVLPGTGQVLIVGGDLTINKQRNYSQSLVELFDPNSNTLSPLDKMVYPRWYPSAIGLPDGDVVVIGGRLAPAKPAIVPEIFNSSTGWRALFGASSAPAFSGVKEVVSDDVSEVVGGWYYPRGFYTNSGNILIVGYGGDFFILNPNGNGSMTRLPPAGPTSNNQLPITMYAPGKLFSVRFGGVTEEIDITGAKPAITPSPGLGQDRFWASTTVMADGRVFIDGGSQVANQLVGVAYQTYVWDPASNTMTPGPVATKPRLYHSTALLLPDGSVLTGGGGVPGPIQEMNAEIYYPSYLYLSDGSGMPAPRPTLVLDQSSTVTSGTITGTVGAGQTIERITMIRAGAATHSANLDQRLVDLAFAQSGSTITATLPDTTALTPGYYMVFAFDTHGVPAIANFVQVAWPTTAPSR